MRSAEYLVLGAPHRHSPPTVNAANTCHLRTAASGLRGRKYRKTVNLRLAPSVTLSRFGWRNAVHAVLRRCRL